MLIFLLVLALTWVSSVNAEGSPIYIDKEILSSVDKSLFDRFSIEGALAAAYPSSTLIYTPDSFPAHSSLRIKRVYLATGSFVQFKGETLKETGPAWAMLIQKTIDNDDEESWFPELVVLQQEGDALHVVAQTGLEAFNYVFDNAEDSGSSLALSTLPIGQNASALVVTLLKSRGNDDFGEVHGNTKLYVLQNSDFHMILDLETEQANSSINLAEKNPLTTTVGMTSTFTCKADDPKSLKDILVNKSEFTITGSRKTVFSMSSENYSWNAKLLQYSPINAHE